jgi:hypothetical protein
MNRAIVFAFAALALLASCAPRECWKSDRRDCREWCDAHGQRSACFATQSGFDCICKGAL